MDEVDMAARPMTKLIVCIALVLDFVATVGMQM